MLRFWLKVDKDGPVPESRPELGPCWVWTGVRQAVRCLWGHHNGGKERCDNGHPFNDANTHILPDGSRCYRTCRSAAGRRYRQRVRETRA